MALSRSTHKASAVPFNATAGQVKKKAIKRRNLRAKIILSYGSDFSGKDAPAHALKRLGVRAKHTFASDTNKHCKTYMLNTFAPAIFYDDVTLRNHAATPAVDLYVFGAPCQPFSSNGKGLGRQDARCI